MTRETIGGKLNTSPNLLFHYFGCKQWHNLHMCFHEEKWVIFLFGMITLICFVIRFGQEWSFITRKIKEIKLDFASNTIPWPLVDFQRVRDFRCYSISSGSSMSSVWNNKVIDGTSLLAASQNSLAELTKIFPDLTFR